MEIFKKVLGSSYGGPSIGFEDGRWILYEWGDAPVSMDVLVAADTWVEFIQKVKEYHENL